MAGYGDKPFGLRDLKLTKIDGSVQVDLPYGMTLSFKERVTSGELRGDDATVSIVAITDAAEWSIEAGGISLEAYALMTGRSVVTAGTTPNRTTTLSANAGDNFPYFKIYGKIINDDGSDIHVLIYKAKLTDGLEGEWKDGEFFIQSASGIAIDDGSKMFEMVHNETATTVPAS